jgi:hypothetical protein
MSSDSLIAALWVVSFIAVDRVIRHPNRLPAVASQSQSVTGESPADKAPNLLVRF